MQCLTLIPLLALQEAHAALQLAQQAEFHLATANIHHLRGDFTAALSCHIAHTSPAHTFAYIHRVLASRPVRPALLARFKAAVCAEMPVLIALDGLAAADAVLRHMDDDQADILASLAGDSELQYR
jgi:hypothetical protein